MERDQAPAQRVRRRLRALLAGCVLMLPVLARAHDFWIEPERFVLDAAEPVAITLRVGERYGGDTVPYVTDWIDRFELHDPRGVQPITGHVGDDPAGVVTPVAAGATWIAYQSRDDFVELPPAKFRDYLEQEGMEYILPLREARGLAERPAREYYVRCVKALLWRPGDGGLDVGAPLGLTLELLPGANPYALSPGRSLDVRLLHAGQPLAGALLRAFTREAPGEVQERRSDADGRVTLDLDRAGTWMVKTVHMVPVEGDRYGEWRSYWASLTFELR